VTGTFSFDEDALVFKVGGKICFILTNALGKGVPAVNLKCDPERAQELQAQYEGVIPGFHSSKKEHR
jgi:predicted DNA-binding protein (MmcQ/YjbR family)